MREKTETKKKGDSFLISLRNWGCFFLAWIFLFPFVSKWILAPVLDYVNQILLSN